jgi:hypothetical protein
MGRLRKFRHLPRHEKELLCEACILLLFSSASIKVIAFRHIEKFLRIHWTETIRNSIESKQEIKLVRRSISRAANVLPWRNLCLSRSVAEFIMLRRRGIPASIFAGARFSGRSSLEAHAWVDTTQGTGDVGSNKPEFRAVIRIGE